MFLFKERDTPGGEHYIQVEDGRDTVGYANSRANPNKTLTLIAIWVDENIRNHGLATRMLNRLEKYALNQGADLVVGEFKPDPGSEKDARTFYERRGFLIEDDRLYKPLTEEHPQDF